MSAPSLTTIIEETPELLDEPDETMVWDPRTDLPDDAPTRDTTQEFYFGWETNSPTVRLTYIIPISIGAATAAQLRNHISEA